MSINSAMDIARQGILVSQSALNIVSNNVVNVNTEGYCKQRVDLATRTTYSKTYGSTLSELRTSGGVQIEDIVRYANENLASYYREQNSAATGLEKSSEISTFVADLMNELSGVGLEKSFEEFYSAVNNLNSYPTDSSVRNEYVEKTKNLVSKFNNMATDLINERDTYVGNGVSGASLMNSQINDYVEQVNALLENIADVNKQMIGMNNGNALANNLLDTRDQMLTELSGLINIETSVSNTGIVDISINGRDLVRGGKVTGELNLTLGDEHTPAVVNILNEEGTAIKYTNINSLLTGGKIGGILTVCSEATPNNFTIDETLTKLNQLANGFAKIINDIQGAETSKCVDNNVYPPILRDTTTDEKALFVTNDGSGTITAANIKVNDVIANNPFSVVAAKVDDPVNYDPRDVGNSKAALDMSKTRTLAYNFLDNQSPENYLMTTASKVGLQAETIDNKLLSQLTSLKSTDLQLKSETGVDLAEEMTDMLKFQRAYEASARVFNVCCSIYDVLVNLGA